MIYDLSNSGYSYDLEWPSRSFTCCKPFQMRFLVQSCHSWQDFMWLRALRGPSAITELLAGPGRVIARVCLSVCSDNNVRKMTFYLDNLSGTLVQLDTKFFGQSHRSKFMVRGRKNHRMKIVGDACTLRGETKVRSAKMQTGIWNCK